MKHNLWDRMMYRLLQEKKEKEVKASKSKGAKPDFLDLDKDGDKEEPMSKASKEAGGKKDAPKAKKGKGKIPPQLKMHIQKKKKSKLDEEIERLEKILFEEYGEENKGMAWWDKPESSGKSSGSDLLDKLKKRLKTMEGSDESGYGGWDESKDTEWYYDDAEGGYYNEAQVIWKNPEMIKVFASAGGPTEEKTFPLKSESDVDDIIKFVEAEAGLREGSPDEDDDELYEGEEEEEYEEEEEDDESCPFCGSEEGYDMYSGECEECGYEAHKNTPEEDIDDPEPGEGWGTEEGEEEYLTEAEVKKKQPRLGKVTRNPSGSKKKFHVYVKCGGRVKKISFGDPGLSIKRDSPARRKNFRARHKCDKPAGKDRCTARYWSCYQWRAGKKVEGEE